MNDIVLANIEHYVSAAIPFTRIAIFQVLISALFYNTKLEWDEQDKISVTHQVF